MVEKKSKVKNVKSKAKTVKVTKPAVKKAVVKKVVAKVAKAEVKEVAKAPTPLKLRGASRIEAKIAVSKPKVVSLNAPVLDIQGKVAGHIQLPEEVFGAKINNPLMSQAVRVYLANQRLGTAKIKERGEVDRTTKKVYQQKGTGRARHGSRRAPIYVGGGKVFGPRPHDFGLTLSKKMRRLALFSALSSKLRDNEIKIVKGLETLTPKTKLVAQALKNLEVASGTKILLVLPKIGKESENIYRASRNIEGVELLGANTLNAYSVLDNKMIVLMRDAVDAIQNTFLIKK